MGNIKTTWEYSLETEALRLLHTAHQISVGFYKVNNFIVLPYGPDYKDTSIVTFPDLPYYKIPRFWEKAKQVDINQIPVKASPNIIEDVKKFLNKQKLDEPKMDAAKNLWSKAQDEVLAEIEKIMPDKKGAISSITIYPTKLGTGTSFNRPSRFPANIHLYLREDRDIYTITEAILTSLTRHDVYTKLEGVWQESELLVDWLVSSSSITKILQKFQPQTKHTSTMLQIRIKQRADLLQKSQEFYERLGVPLMDNVFTLKGETPTIFGNPAYGFSSREKEILSLMIKRGSQIVTIDELANILFKDEDAFSLQAIAKQIQRLRDKLEANGVSGSFIQTKRGQGYMLVN